MNDRSPPGTGFRTDINGLRALAVLAVLLYHFGVPGVQGGFVGVDVFFVISGYLMTAIIFTRMNEARFSLLDFYLERGRRIIPALAALCCAVLVAGWFLLLPSDYAALGRQAASSMGFFSNYTFWREAGYFDTASHEKWLLHTWSLSVEWQFYLLYPLAVLLLRRLLPAAWTRWCLAALAVLSFMLARAAARRWPSAGFFLLPTRAWEMWVGGMIFLFPVWMPTVLRRAAEGTGLGLILFSVVTHSRAEAWPGALAAIPVAGAALVIVAARGTSALTGNPIAQLLGQCSYSVYLWHWPLAVVLRSFGEPDLARTAAALLLAIALGHASFVLVERPAGRLGRRPGDGRWIVACYLLPVVGAVVVMGLGVAGLDGLPGTLRAINSDEGALLIARYDDLHRNGLAESYHFECDFYDETSKAGRTEIDGHCTEAGGPDAVFLWGDSHAQALSLGLRTLFPGAHRVAQVATSACPPTLGLQLRPPVIDNRCDFSNRYALAQIARLKPGVVVVAQAAGHEATDWNALADHLHRLGAGRVVLVGPAPNWQPSLPIVVARARWSARRDHVRNGLDDAPFRTDAILKERYRDSRPVTYISLLEPLCREDGCLALLPGEAGLLVVDYGHLSPAGSIFVARTVLATKLRAFLSP